MLSLTSGPNHLSILKKLTFCPISTTFSLLGTHNFLFLHLQSSHFGYLRLVRKVPSLSCFRERDWESEREIELELELEGEILEFMKGSEKPGDFPTKEELVRAGRTDLVDAIVRKRGWLSMGWDLDGCEGEFVGGEERGKGEENGKLGEENRIFGEENGNLGEENGTLGEENCNLGDAVRTTDESVERFEQDRSCGLDSSSQSPMSSGRLFEMGEEEDETGVQGILSRLEKERNWSLGVNLVRLPLSRYCSDDWFFEAPGDAEDRDQLRKSRVLLSISSTEGKKTNSGGKCSPHKSFSDIDGSWSSSEPGMVKTLTIKQGSLSTDEYEDDDLNDENLVTSEGFSEVLDEIRDNDHNDIRTRLQHLEHELASTLISLRSNREKLIPKEGYGTTSNIHELSDAMEFQETEIMNAKNNLRSIRAKLAVLEGKMTLAIIGARKTIDEKQRKIDSACRALQLLRTTSIVWPNSASEVFLVGSFDGWTTQRRMKKSNNGIFSVELKLYPGKYEIKFVVDGVWKVDPLRPIVNNNGYENNLFIVSLAAQDR